MANVFGLPPGLDFPKAFVDGLNIRFADTSPTDFARITLIVNTRRMARRIRAIFDAGPPRLLPRVVLLGDVEQLLKDVSPPAPVASLRRRLELASMIEPLVAGDSSLAEKASLFGLADSLAALMDEMQGEGVDAQTLADLDVSNHSEHFAQTKAFLEIVQSYLAQTRAAPDAEERQRHIVTHLIQQWEVDPPKDPIVLAGSTASRGTTRLLAEAVAKLDNGSLVLPGFDFDLPASVWGRMDGDDAHLLPTQDHPQYRFQAIMRSLDMTKTDVGLWSDLPPPSPKRNALISLAMRPAPVTDAWSKEGPNLGDLNEPTQNLTLIEAETPRAEALAIALRLRQAAEDGQAAALITPDRMLTRQVAAALDRWDITPDDSAGLPLHHSPPGRLLRHVASLFSQKLDAELLLTLLKHPLTNRGADRNAHLLNTQRLELAMRDAAMPFPDPDTLHAVSAKLSVAHGEAFTDWLTWVVQTFCGQERSGDARLLDWAQSHRALAERVAAGPTGDPAELWARNAGEKARSVMDAIVDQSDAATDMGAYDYADLLGTLLSAEEVRDRDEPVPGVMIWGTLEARVQGADLVILGGLNENTWPESPDPDPWLNRALRHKAGLLLPDRRIGLAAHDFQQAFGAPDVWLTRSVRSSDAETVPSRWLNRLTNLMSGLKDNGGIDALAAMRARGRIYLDQARLIEAPIESARANRPAPRPPIAARPRKISVSDIRRLVRDPYAVYARKCLRLQALGALRPTADHLLRGTTLHSVFETFLHGIREDPNRLNSTELLKVAKHELETSVPWATARTLWFTRLERIADWFVTTEQQRQDTGAPFAFEIPGLMDLPDIGMQITAKADRIDLTEDGRAVVLDYKTGKPPSAAAQVKFERQLLIEAVMVENGAFQKLGPRVISQAQYIGLTASPSIVDAPIAKETPDKVLTELRTLLAAYLIQDQGYSSRRAHFRDADTGDYDHLARFGEWDSTQEPVAEDVG
ncbi:MAG: double-strand break repair protein AddB [Paracoccaceae bacterium]